MSGLIASLIFLLAPAQTNAAVMNESGRVMGWLDKSLVRQADVALNTNGTFLLQWRSLDIPTWEGMAVVYGDRTNRVTLPVQEGYLRLLWKQ